MKKNTIIYILFMAIIVLFLGGCATGLPAMPGEQDDSQEEGAHSNNDNENTGMQRVVIIELFNTEGCAASKAINPIIENIVSEYDQTQVILVEEAGWGKHSIAETTERFKWYFSDKSELHTPAVCFNGLNQLLAQGFSLGGGSSSGSSSSPVNHAPQITSSPKITATVNLIYQYQVEAVDTDNDALTYSLPSCPEGMSIHQENGLISWTPSPGDIGDIPVTVEVSDGSKKANQSFVLHVHDALTSIEVVVEKSELITGQSSCVSQVTAHYQSGSDWNITPLSLCQFSVDIGSEILAINSSGVFTSSGTGSATVIVTYSEGGQTVEDSFSINIVPLSLQSISALPESMILEMGKTQLIDSVTAYYNDNSEKDIALTECQYDVISGESYVSVDTNGQVSAQAEGGAVVEVTYQENTISASDEITVEVSNDLPVYRLLAVGVGDYDEGSDMDLGAPPLDVNRLTQTFTNASFTLAQSVSLTDGEATKNAILNAIGTTFDQADENDVSYFYFSGHGATLDTQCYLCPADFNGLDTSAISIDELEQALSAIAGTKVVFLDCCHSGGFIGKDVLLNDPGEQAEQFNQSVVRHFSSYLSRDNLVQDGYQVLTACSQNQSAFEIIPPTDDPYGLFTKLLCDGIGYDSDYPADSEPDNKVSLQEAYDYVSEHIVTDYPSLADQQNIQIYPENSIFSIITYE